MKLAKRIKDSFILGMFGGLVSIFIFYYVIEAIRSLIVSYNGNPYTMRPPVVQLLTMMINIIIFRLLVINLDKEKTGKGFLLITVLMTLGYFFIYLKLQK